MLILVAVTINMAINGGLFSQAGKATGDTKNALNAEQELANGKIKIGDKVYDSIDDYLAGKVSIVLPEGWTKTTKPDTWDSEKVTAITDGTNTVPLPEGYDIVETAKTIEEGLVIKDSKDNEFVWIPVVGTFTSTYSSSSNYSEPTVLTWTYPSSGAAGDSQATLDYYYGENYYSYATDFNYASHYAEMVTSVNKYHGFYVGRYETTINGVDVGSVYNTKVLTAGDKFASGAAQGKYYRWYGLYDEQRKCSVVGNGSYLQTNMIWGQQWDAIISILDSKSISYAGFGTTSGVVNSAQSTNISNQKDVLYNIYDLRTNAFDWTAEAYNTSNRVYRGR